MRRPRSWRREFAVYAQPRCGSSVAAGVPPAVEPWRPARRKKLSSKRPAPELFGSDGSGGSFFPGGETPALYVRPEARHHAATSVWPRWGSGGRPACRRAVASRPAEKTFVKATGPGIIWERWQWRELFSGRRDARPLRQARGPIPQRGRCLADTDFMIVWPLPFAGSGGLACAMAALMSAKTPGKRSVLTLGRRTKRFCFPPP